MNAQARDSAIAGASAGLVSSVVTCPLDVIKTRLQVMAEPGTQSGIYRVGRMCNPLTADIISRIWHDDGLRGYYRGLVPTMVGYLPTWAIYFVVYDKGKTFFSSQIGTSRRRTHTGTGRKHDFLIHICSAMTAGVISTTCTSPFWVVKTRTMVCTCGSRSSKPLSSRPTNDITISSTPSARSTCEGVGGFYKGLLPSLLGVFHVVVQFPLYEYFKSLAGTSSLAHPSATRQHSDHLSPTMILLCSGGSKMLASMATYPHEVLRTRLQMVPQSGHAHYTGLFQAISVIFQREGIRGFYKGMGVNLIRTVPNSGLTLLTYEVIMGRLEAMRRPP